MAEGNAKAASWYHAILAGLSTGKIYTLFCSMSETCNPCSKAVYLFSMQACKNNHRPTELHIVSHQSAWCAIHSIICPFSILKQGQTYSTFSHAGQCSYQNPSALSNNPNVERGWNGQTWRAKEFALSPVSTGVALDSTWMLGAMF